jgi:tripartite-type tricarboxylate transporter receptor subunit TctC
VNNWYGILGPAGIPPKTVAALASAILKGVASNDMRERLATLALEPKSSTPKELEALLHEETKKWRHVISTAKIKID